MEKLSSILEEEIQSVKSIRKIFRPKIIKSFIPTSIHVMGKNISHYNEISEKYKKKLGQFGLGKFAADYVNIGFGLAEMSEGEYKKMIEEIYNRKSMLAKLRKLRKKLLQILKNR